ncbi:hypothetical protein CHGG_02123 [Chaetomium globosum CBS 148.51]|uniref:Rho-GAP domain-containing protein n=1 Tax=Chaetomium globosum (strain ATCC 6205 / CBS 148.51 / DSM 1962 / NBRC 6347 / NRRL 1970) TaxID=306901 RepID=Q2HCD1_CHAGB|nr:uncharacterized protein CHGG_02123 [Chaetomium globosum CBS 148.51]EAQ93888.1 hypothetical protein CHGG_02123 [Chaetomium globosum CBS 148.51]
MDGANLNAPVDAACSAASDAISRTLSVIGKFVREVRESRSDFDSISTELHSLNGVLDLLGYDAAFLSASLAEHTRAVLETCLAIINELEGCVSLLNRPDVPKAEKRSRWLASRDHINTLRRTLGEYKLVLGLAADLVGLTKSQASSEIGGGLSDNRRQTRCDGGAQDNELAMVTAQIIELSGLRKISSQQSVALVRLEQYLDALRAEAQPESRSSMPPQRNVTPGEHASSIGSRTSSRTSSAFGPVLDSVWENPRAEVPSPVPPSTASSDTSQREHQSGILRRSGSKFSTTFRGFGLRRPSLRTVDDEPEPQADAVFGVPLVKSIQVAKGVASTRHGSGGSSARATREYPLSVLRCVYHIRDCGLEIPHIFGLSGDRVRLAQLKEVFNSADTSYGKELDWNRFTIHEAADLILVFLSELPKPIIPESVGKRWISLSRQATIGGARLDQGLDFWEEAMMGIHGAARALFKLLVGLWGDIADAADANMMTAERLAGRVIRPLMHTAAARRETRFSCSPLRF